ncbi:expressed protein [Dictyostelium purpureum]|uniref:Expressed protein n=1 Tax=Dictyostelium purpureum TaxID=5786 RepID=F0ZX96_DICPU|nr:uncharacterized protein DICPUDRAFT_92799 [Dictyostelium purpureum]EGC31434.1 expressed protein [Dictyostelium purpureum]|eukprot:XP_003292033.1 expressed protein [Dictyostelium purpureum]
MLPQISPSSNLNFSFNNNLGNNINDPINIDDDESMNSNNNQRPGLSKIVSQDSFVELPIKKHRK